MSSTTEKRQRKRGYQKARFYSAITAAPEILDRAADTTTPNEDLRPLEIAAREIRNEILDDLGPDVSAAKRALVDVAVGSLLVVGSVDRYLFREAGSSGCIDRRAKQIRRLVLDRSRLATGLTQQLLALGLEKRQPERSLSMWLAERPDDGEVEVAGAGDVVHTDYHETTNDSLAGQETVSTPQEGSHERMARKSRQPSQNPEESEGSS